MVPEASSLATMLAGAFGYTGVQAQTSQWPTPVDAEPAPSEPQADERVCARFYGSLSSSLAASGGRRLPRASGTSW
jgi:hypothetical protein